MSWAFGLWDVQKLKHFYLRPFNIAIYGKFHLYYLCLLRLFLVCKLYSCGLQIMSLIFMPSYFFGQCWYWRFLEVEILRSVSLSYFFSCFFSSVNFTNQVSISSHILNKGNGFIWGFLVFSLVFLSILSLLFLATFPDMEMLQFWSVNYIYQACKSYFYILLYFCFYVRNFGQYLYLSVFSKQWKCPTFSFC